MGVLQEGSWCCFLAGRGKSERVKVSIFTSKGPALAAISVAVGAGGVWGWGGGGTGFLIHRNLLLTTHAILPTVVAAEAAEVRLCHGRLSARLVPQRSIAHACSGKIHNLWHILASFLVRCLIRRPCPCVARILIFELRTDQGLLA